MLTSLVIMYFFTYLYLDRDDLYYFKSFTFIAYFCSMIVSFVIDCIIKFNSVTTNIIINVILILYTSFIPFELYEMYNTNKSIYYYTPFYMTIHIYTDTIMFPFKLIIKFL